MAGIAVGDDGDGPNFGIARGAGLIAIQVFSRVDDPVACGGTAPCIRAFGTDLIQALEHVFDLRYTFAITAANLSLGSGRYFDRESCDQANPALKAAVDQLRSVGIATVIATGNDGFVDSVGWPACVSSAVSVGATEDDDDLYSLGNVASFVDLMAPGKFVVSSVPGNAVDSKTGTSMAAPHVAGAWAVVKQLAPGASVGEVLGLLRDTATVVHDDRPNGEVSDLRRINLDLALALAGSGQEFVISNTGTGSLTVTSLELEEPGSWISWSPQAPFEVEAGGSVTVDVSVDWGSAPGAGASRRLLVLSNDPDESPYPEAVYIIIDESSTPECHLLETGHTGLGGDPEALPESSAGCPHGYFVAGEVVELTAAPAIGWRVVGWSGTTDDGSTSIWNEVVMPDAGHAAGVTYGEVSNEIFWDGFEAGSLSLWSGISW